MAKKYKLSRKYMNEFFGLMGKPIDGKAQTKLQRLIANDPKLKAIDARIKKLNKIALDRAHADDELLDMLKDIGISPEDLR